MDESLELLLGAALAVFIAGSLLERGLAPLYAAPDVDRRAIAMAAVAVPTTVLGSMVAARWMARRAEVQRANVGVHS